MEEKSATVRGRVMKGERIGRTLGFPTANIAMSDGSIRDGVYVAEAILDDGTRHEAVADVGHRPSVSAAAGRRLEVHLLDFEGDLYGQTIEVKLLHRLRPEQRFDTMDELHEHIKADAAAAREWFARRKQEKN